MVGSAIRSDYFYGKCIWAIAYSENSKQTINYLFNFFCIDASRVYSSLIDFLNENNYFLDDFARNNLVVLVQYLKNVLPSYDFKGIDSKIRDDSFTLIDGFILSQYEKRFMYDEAPASLVSSDNKDKYFDILKSMIVNDMDILITHSTKCDEKTFEMNKSNKYVNDILKYIGSINMIIGEYPSILEDEVFLSRVNFVSDRMEEIKKSDNTQMIYTMFKKKIR